MAVRVEFTVEPFVEGSPGPHVKAAEAAARDAGAELEVGPFGSAFEASSDVAAAAVAALLRAATDQGASRISLQVTTV